MSSSAAHFAWIPASTPARHSDQSEAPQPPSPEQLYSALDGREVEVWGKRHRVEVYSVRDEIGRRWVQLALRGEPAYLVTLKLAKSDGVEEVLFALSCGAPVSFARVDAAPTKPH